VRAFFGEAAEDGEGLGFAGLQSQSERGDEAQLFVLDCLLSIAYSDDEGERERKSQIAALCQSLSNRGVLFKTAA
jgi:hypothetical protein